MNERINISNIKDTTWNGEPALLFSAGGYEALIIPGVGANVIQLKDISRDLSLLRTPENLEDFKNRPQIYGIPLLFPPNRIEDGTFTIGETKYVLPINDTKNNNHIHGFIRTLPWHLTKTECISDDIVEVEVTFVSNAENDSIFTYFPHEFECKLLYRLSEKGLEQTFSIINNSSSPMPLGIGYHTAFNVPFSSESNSDNCRLMVSVGEQWELNGRNLPTGKLLELTDNNKCYREGGIDPFKLPLDNHYLSKSIKFHDKDFNGAIIQDDFIGIRLVYEAGPEYKHWTIWNDGGNKGFVCPEPQTWMINAPNVKLSDSLTGFKLLEPTKTWSESTRIYVEEI